MKKTTLSLSLLAVATLAFSQPSEEAYQNGNYFVAGQTLQNNAPLSTFYLGKLRLYGYGVLKNNPLALQYFTEAANKGYLPAEQFLARYHLMAKNSPADALEWFKKAANQGDNTARMYCAAAYLFGYGASKNPDLARKYYIDAAKDGVPLAQYTLASYFLDSKDANSKKLGLIWLNKSAEKGNAQAKDKLGQLLLTGQLLPQDLAKAKILFKEATQQGLVVAMIHLGEVAMAEHNYLAARDWFQKAIQHESIEASLALADLYLLQDTPLYNPQEAFKLIQQVAHNTTQPSSIAALRLAELYEKGIGTTASPTEASTWREKANTIEKNAAKLNTITTLLADWLSEGKTKQLNHTAYALQGILSHWTNPQALADNHYNQFPEVPEVKADEIYKPQFVMVEPNSLPMSDYFDHITTYAKTSVPTLTSLPQYPLHSTFASLLRHDSPILNHANDKVFIYPDALVNTSDEAPDIFVLLSLVPPDQNRRLNYQSALFDLYNRAILGESASQFDLGQLYNAGVAVAKNFNQALTYYQLAATQQEVRAEYNLGLLYLTGLTDPVDYQKGIDWLMDAAFKGNAYAQYALGTVYRYGFTDREGNVLIEPNLEQSIAMYSLASSSRFAPAEYQLASVLVKQNQSLFNLKSKRQRNAFIKALYQDASNQGIAEAKLPLAFYQAMSKDKTEQQRAFDTAKTQAENHQPGAALLLAMLYDRGIGTEPNAAEARQWYAQSIQHPISAFILGSYAGSGLEGGLDKKRAKSLLSFAAEKNLGFAGYNLAILQYQNQDPGFLSSLIKAQTEGNPTAALLLADYYLSQAKSNEQLDQAVELYTKFAEKGDPHAATKLGYLYDRGIGVNSDPATAEKWYLIAAQQNQPLGQYLLGQLYQSGRLADGANIPEALRWFRASDKHHNPYAPIALGFIEETFDENYAQAAQDYTKAAPNNPIALYNLGLIKAYGKGAPVDYAAALSLFEKAADLNHAPSMTQLGLLYQNGLGTKKKLKTAEVWYEKAAAKNDPEALYQLGLIVLPQQPEIAAKYFEKAADLGHEPAMLEFANLLHTGKGVAKDDNKAIELYTKAANNHNEVAAAALKRMATEQQNQKTEVKPQDLTKTEPRPTTYHPSRDRKGAGKY